jgi:L-amino acid N-acyltransferase YncA
VIRRVSKERFDFYRKTGSTFVAEHDGRVVGYVASQTTSFMHGAEKLLWIEYIVVSSEYRHQGIGLALLRRLIEYSKHIGVNRIYTTINPDNEASLKLHAKAGFTVKDWMVASCDMHIEGVRTGAL